MLIAFSGIVGSGKSTNAKAAYRMLTEMCFPALYLRFRFLSWRSLFRPLTVGKQKSQIQQEVQKPAARNEALRSKEILPLTLIRCLGYLWRMMIFRMFVTIKLRQVIGICDRFFYDNLAHYCLSNRRERIYLWILKKALPEPDLALMMTANPEQIIQRRQHYNPNYIFSLSANYEKLFREFPNLTIVKTDHFADLDRTIAHYVKEALHANDIFSESNALPV